jgi:hypothetical protein
MVILDGANVNVALPSIQRDLHFSASGGDAAFTHVIDPDQRSVVLKTTGVQRTGINAVAPPSGQRGAAWSVPAVRQPANGDGVDPVGRAASVRRAAWPAGGDREYPDPRLAAPRPPARRRMSVVTSARRRTTLGGASARVVGLVDGLGDCEHLLTRELHSVLSAGVGGAGGDDVVFTTAAGPTAITLDGKVQFDHLPGWRC